MLGCHKKELKREERAQIISALAEKIPLHGHAVGRREAKAIGLTIVHPESALDDSMWNLLQEYEQEMEMLTPLDPESLLDGKSEDETEAALTLAMIESVELTSAFTATMRVRRVRQMPEALNLNLNVNLSLPAGVDPQSMPPNVQQLLQQLV